MKNTELNMENMKNVNGGAHEEYVEPVVDDYKEQQDELNRRIKEQQKKVEALSLELMEKIHGGAAEDDTVTKDPMEEELRRRFERPREGLTNVLG